MAGLLAVALAAGCVDRRFIIESNVPNAQVYIDNKPIGAAPVDAPWEYSGYYNITIVHPNYAPLVKKVRVRPKWYAYPPFDFVAEVLWPFRIEDTRRFYFELQQPVQVQTEELKQQGELLRQRGMSLPPPPDHPPASTPTPAVAPSGNSLPAPAVLPGETRPLPETAPVLPAPTPAVPAPVVPIQ